MKIWRLIAHHENSDEAIEIMKSTNRIAIGWSKIGDLREIKPTNSTEIRDAIKANHPKNDNSHLGGPSLWNFYSNTKEGDIVIVNANGKRQCVFEVIGPYYFDQKHEILGYSHIRNASLTSIDANDLWESTGSSVAEGENQRWTYAACQVEPAAREKIYFEGNRFSVTSTTIERNSRARDKCLELHGYSCAVCGFSFEEVYGSLGHQYIHVHHRVDLAAQHSTYEVNPETDLIPLCPNCHAMVHQETPAMSIDELKNIVDINSEKA